KSGGRYLKDLVGEVEDSPTGSSAAAWRKQLDHRLISGCAPEPAGCMEVASLACSCLDGKRKNRPAMTEVFDKLQDITRKNSFSSSSPLHHPPHRHLQPRSLSFPRPPHPLDFSVVALSDQLSKLGPLEDTYQPSASSFCSLPPSSSSSFASPCETDESRGFSQYDLRSQCRSNGTSFRSLSTRPPESQLSRPSVHTEDQYNSPPQSSSSSDRPGAGALTEAAPGQDTAECLSHAGSLRSESTESSVHMNPSKQRFLQKKTLYEEGRIQTPELPSSEDLYGGRSSDRGPEESDELDYLPAQHD
ncbi:interleukin-1 receptor-associated kinase 1, partial [Cottoperca gobio]|uniref:Interleukin-1 receptor-associated kinase 1 n=1 Tax=Cottoperca gobio TaxID=56716 RepID=A0A6J2PEE5_COTGO